MEPTTPRRGFVHGVRMASAVVALVVAIAGCAASTASTAPGSATTSSAPSVAASAEASGAGGSSAVCQDLAATKASISSLATLDVKAAGADGVKAAIATVRTSFETLKASAGADLAPSVTAVTTALDNLQTTVDAANGDMNSAAAPIGRAVLGLAAALSALETAAKSTCG
jgi:hypothetical protein